MVNLISCDENNNVQKKHEQIEQIVMTISQGGREIPYVPGKDTIIPSTEEDEIYSLRLNSSGKLVVLYGFGERSLNDVKLNSVVKKDSLFIDKDKLKDLVSMAQRINSHKSYKTNKSPTDSWLIKLEINNKESIFYSGENVDGSASTINKDYIDIVQKMVNLSPIKIYYRRTNG